MDPKEKPPVGGADVAAVVVEEPDEAPKANPPVDGPPVGAEVDDCPGLGAANEKPSLEGAGAVALGAAVEVAEAALPPNVKPPAGPSVGAGPPVGFCILSLGTGVEPLDGALVDPKDGPGFVAGLLLLCAGALEVVPNVNPPGAGLA